MKLHNQLDFYIRNNRISLCANLNKTVQAVMFTVVDLNVLLFIHIQTYS